MTILFPGRKLDTKLSAFTNTKFRDDVTKCIATRIDKRHIVYDYAVSQDNVVFVPTQDENAWLNDMDWSPFVTLKLYQPDFRSDGQVTQNAILQSVWQMHQDGSLKAVGVGNKPTKQRLPVPVTSSTKFGLVVEEAEDVVSRAPSEMQRSKSDAFPMYNRGGPAVDFARQAQQQYYSHSRRVTASEPTSPAEFAGMPDPTSLSPPRPVPGLAPFQPTYRSMSPPPMISHHTGASFGGGPGPGGFIRPQISGAQSAMSWNNSYGPEMGQVNGGLSPRSTMQRRRSGASGRISGNVSEISGQMSRAPSQAGQVGEKRIRRKLSKRRSRASLAGSGGPEAWRNPNIPPPQLYSRQKEQDTGCGCIIC